jgi:hypothetical protein
MSDLHIEADAASRPDGLMPTSDADELSRAETKPIELANAALKRALQLMTAYDEKVSTSLAKTQKEHLAALNALHEVCAALTDDEVREAWFAHHDIKTHGNLRNPYQPIVKKILDRAASTEIRKRATRYAGAIAFAIYRDVAVGEFPKLIEDTEGGIEELYKAWRRTETAQSRSTEAKKESVDRMADFMNEFGETDIPPTPATEGHHGLTIAAVEFNEGRIIRLRVLTSDKGKVAQMIERHARTATSEMGDGQ